MILSLFLAFSIIVVCIVGFYVSILNKSDTPDILFSADESLQLIIESKLQYATENSKVAIVEYDEFENTLPRLEYNGVKNCALFKKTYGNLNFSNTSCLGLADCVSVCPQNAISLQKTTINIDVTCNGCGLCIPICPQNIIKLIKQEKGLKL